MRLHLAQRRVQRELLMRQRNQSVRRYAPTMRWRGYVRCGAWGTFVQKWPECREAKIENDAVRRALSQLSHPPEVSVKDWALALTCVPGGEAQAQ